MIASAQPVFDFGDLFTELLCHWGGALKSTWSMGRCTLSRPSSGTSVAPAVSSLLSLALNMLPSKKRPLITITATACHSASGSVKEWSFYSALPYRFRYLSSPMKGINEPVAPALCPLAMTDWHPGRFSHPANWLFLIFLLAVLWKDLLLPTIHNSASILLNICSLSKNAKRENFCSLKNLLFPKNLSMDGPSKNHWCIWDLQVGEKVFVQSKSHLTTF